MSWNNLIKFVTFATLSGEITTTIHVCSSRKINALTPGRELKIEANNKLERGSKIGYRS